MKMIWLMLWGIVELEQASSLHVVIRWFKLILEIKSVDSFVYIYLIIEAYDIYKVLCVYGGLSYQDIR